MPDERRIQGRFRTALLNDQSISLEPFSHACVHSTSVTRYAPHKEEDMPNKITMINAVWMVMMTGMLAVTVALYDHKVDASKVYGPYASARAAVMSQY